MTEYVYDSRRLLVNSEAEVFEYFNRKTVGRKALMVDLDGTGMHLCKIRDMAGLNYSIFIGFLVAHDRAVKIYGSEEHIPTHWLKPDDEPPANHDSLNFYCNDRGYKLWCIEVMNRATHNTPIRMKALRINGQLFPSMTFSGSNDTEELDVLRACLKEVLSSDIQYPAVDWSDRDKSLEELQTILSFFNQECNKSILVDKQTLGASVDKMSNQINNL